MLCNWIINHGDNHGDHHDDKFSKHQPTATITIFVKQICGSQAQRPELPSKFTYLTTRPTTHRNFTNHQLDQHFTNLVPSNLTSPTSPVSIRLLQLFSHNESHPRCASMGIPKLMGSVTPNLGRCAGGQIIRKSLTWKFHDEKMGFVYERNCMIRGFSQWVLMMVGGPQNWWYTKPQSHWWNEGLEMVPFNGCIFNHDSIMTVIIYHHEYHY